MHPLRYSYELIEKPYSTSREGQGRSHFLLVLIPIATSQVWFVMRWAGLMPIHVKCAPPSAMTHVSRPLLGPCTRQSRLALAPPAT